MGGGGGGGGGRWMSAALAPATPPPGGHPSRPSATPAVVLWQVATCFDDGASVAGRRRVFGLR